MMKKQTYKPLYKNFIRLRKNIQNRNKLYHFKKKKWQQFLKQITNYKKKKISLYDHMIYYKPKFGFNFRNNFKFYLLTKQKLKLFYGNLADKKLNIFYKKAFKEFKNQKYEYFVNKNFYFLKNLESRLDSIIYRTQFVQSFRTAQQLISHGKILLNGKKIKIHSYLVKKGDLIEIDTSLHTLLKKKIKLSEIQYNIPKYLEINYKTFQCIIISDIKYNKILYTFPFWLNLNFLAK